jgi:hypothetical protein
MRRRRKDDNAAQVKRRSTAKSKHFIYLERVLACRSARAGPGASPVEAERSSVDSAAFNEPERQTPNLPPASAPPPSQSPQPSVEPPSPPNGGHAQTRSLARPNLRKSEQIRVTAWPPPLGDRELKTHRWHARRFLQRNFSPTTSCRIFPSPTSSHRP